MTPPRMSNSCGIRALPAAGSGGYMLGLGSQSVGKERGAMAVAGPAQEMAAPAVRPPRTATLWAVGLAS